MSYIYTGKHKEDLRVLLRFLLKKNLYEQFIMAFEYCFPELRINDAHSVFDKLKERYFQDVDGFKISKNPSVELFLSKIIGRNLSDEWYEYFFNSNKERFKKEWREWLEYLAAREPSRFGIAEINNESYMAITLYDGNGQHLKAKPFDSSGPYSKYLMQHLMIKYSDRIDTSKIVVLQHKFISS